MYKQTKKSQVPTFSRFSRAGFAIFASLHRQVRIGVLSVATLSCVCIEKVEAKRTTTATEADEETLDDHELGEVTVAGTLAPLTQLQAARMVSVITRADIERAAAQTVNDVLKLATGVDVRQRGGFGIQTDISINGATFDQIIILLNGVNISNPHTGHLAADFPVSVADIERVEVLEGAASRVYGASAFGGAVNIVTRQESASRIEAGAQGGSYGTVGADFRGALVPKRRQGMSHQLSGLWQRSDGATENSDFQRGNLFLQGRWEERDVELHWQGGWSRKRYGANTFYSAAYPNQWEANDRLIVSIGAATKGRLRLTPEVYWQRNVDHFQLIRHTGTGENFHRTDVYGARLGLDFRWKGGRTAVVAELRQEGIYSSNLGRTIDSTAHRPHIPHQDGLSYTRHDERTNVAFSAEHNILLGRFTASVGVLANSNSYLGDGFHLYPGIDVSYRFGSQWKAYASFNKGFRLPTFTDLYYKSTTIEGNRGLRAEESHSFQAGVRWQGEWAQASVRAFYNRGRRLIDWVMYTSDDVYHSANFNLDNMGLSTDVRVAFSKIKGVTSILQTFTAGYTYMHQRRHDDVVIYKSNYAMEYLRHKLTASLQHRIWSRLSANWQVRWQDRMGAYIKYVDATSTGQLVAYHPYATLDLKLQWQAPRYQLWMEGTNLTNHTYYDLGNIPQPGFMVLAGARIQLGAISLKPLSNKGH